MKIKNTTTFFAKAHKIAKETRDIVGDYRVAFKIALDELYEAARKEATEVKKVVNLVKKAVKFPTKKGVRVPTKKAQDIYVQCDKTVKSFIEMAVISGFALSTARTQFNACKKYFE